MVCSSCHGRRAPGCPGGRRIAGTKGRAGEARAWARGGGPAADRETAEKGEHDGLPGHRPRVPGGGDVTRPYEPGSPEEDAAIEQGHVPPPRRPLTGGSANRDADERDFSTPVSVLRLVPLAVVVGIGATALAEGLLYLINFIVHLAFFGQVAATSQDPAGTTIGAYMIPIAVAGEIVVGFIARYGSAQIRGHGIPESMITILTGGSKVQPRLTVLKPLASAIAIGTGAPFGAEGPIIVGGGSLGSVVGQLFRLSAAERRALLVAGGMAGMTAVFGTPVGATLFGLEALVFERKPRSLVLIATGCTVAEGIRLSLQAIGVAPAGALFAMPQLPVLRGWILLGAVAVGIAAGAASWLMTQAVSLAEELFRKVPTHWMWWPAMAGVFIGVGGLLDDKALGVGYSIIDETLVGRIALGGLVLLFFVKLVTWAIGLGSGTSGGIIAPILLMGATVGGVMAAVLPGGSEPLWALIGMGATFAAMTRSPFTGIVFTAEVTHSYTDLLPLTIAVFTAHLISVLILKRSILTDKVVRVADVPVTTEYEVNFLSSIAVHEVMRRDPVCLHAGDGIGAARRRVHGDRGALAQRLYPVLDPAGSLVGTLPLAALAAPAEEDATVDCLMTRDPPVVSSSRTLRRAADLMADVDLDGVAVVDGGHVVGVVSVRDVLKADARVLEEERHRQRVLPRSASDRDDGGTGR